MKTWWQWLQVQGSLLFALMFALATYSAFSRGAFLLGVLFVVSTVLCVLGAIPVTREFLNRLLKVINEENDSKSSE